MVEYSKINCKLTNVQLIKLLAVKSNEGGTLRLGIKNFNKDELNINLSTDIKLSKAQIKKLIQAGGFLGKLLSKLVGPLMKVAMPLAKNVLAPFDLTAAMPAITKNIHGSGVRLVIEQEDMNDIMKIIEALDNSGILLKGISKTIENETKEQRGRFLSMLLGTLGASLLGNLLSGKGMMRAGEGIVTAGEGSVTSRA